MNDKVVKFRPKAKAESAAAAVGRPSIFAAAVIAVVTAAVVLAIVHFLTR